MGFALLCARVGGRGNGAEGLAGEGHFGGEIPEEAKKADFLEKNDFPQKGPQMPKRS